MLQRTARGRALRGLAAIGVLALSLGLGLGSCRRAGPPVAGVPDRVDFNFHVKPILSDRCFKCHGPDDRQRKAGLRLDVKEAAFAELESGRRAIVAGKPARSELVRRITSTDPKVMMPVPDSHLTLDEVEKATLVRWIEQGAEWKPHWAFIPPTRPPVPAVRTANWARADLDRFVLAALEAKNWKPSAEAPRETWLRRVTFDLAGLPPTPAEIEAFLADRSTTAYEQVVDRLLASHSYGERMAADWLDVARYADSHGYQDDGMRDMWPWRDWVIGAFNRNLRVDHFITWQLAGDLLPQATQEQRLATGFNRNHMQSQEGGIVGEEYRTEYVVDRVNTLGRAFLGLSVECARCHDHKYDPVTQKEFFQLYAFFNNVNEVGQIPYSGVPSPSVIVSNPEADMKLAALAAKIVALEAELDPASARHDPAFARWLATAAEAARASVATPPGLIAHFPFEAPEKVIEPPKPGTKLPPPSQRRPPKPILRFANLVDARERGRVGDIDRPTATVPGRFGSAQQIAGDSFLEAGRKVAFFERNEPFAIGFWVRVDRPGTSGPLFTRSGGIMNGNRGYDIDLLPDGSLTAGLHHVDPDNAVQVATTGAVLKPGAWHHVALTWDGSSRAAGIGLFVDGARPATRVVIDHLRRSIVYDGTKKNWGGGETPIRFGRRGDERLDGVTIDELRVFDRQLSRFEVQALAGVDDPLGAVLKMPAASRSAEQLADLREHWSLRADPASAATRRALVEVRGEENDLLTSLPEVMAMRDRAVPRQTFVLARGAYDAPTDRVEAGTPEVLGAFPKTLPANRLGLARWLTAKEHPLTARVIVNRYWAQLFGRGLVATPADFGSQGRLPTHPALLDWLATGFVASGWDLKALQKQIVLSATYRQSSIADAAARERDPANEWLARGPSHRLSAEQVRDAALAAGGLLVRDVGGPSVYPYQPAGLWEALATRNATSYEEGRGDDLYRRSLYTVWKRSSPPPSAISFDAAERLFCTVTRQRTSTPLQALVLLNDPQFVEAARAVGERMLREGGPDAPARIGFAFRALAGRAPAPAEIAVLATLFSSERERFRHDRAAAAKLLAVGASRPKPGIDQSELAAATVVASTIMNTDDAVMKR